MIFVRLTGQLAIIIGLTMIVWMGFQQHQVIDDWVTPIILVFGGYLVIWRPKNFIDKMIRYLKILKRNLKEN